MPHYATVALTHAFLKAGTELQKACLVSLGVLQWMRKWTKINAQKFYFQPWEHIKSHPIPRCHPKGVLKVYGWTPYSKVVLGQILGERWSHAGCTVTI